MSSFSRLVNVSFTFAREFLFLVEENLTLFVTYVIRLRFSWFFFLLLKSWATNTKNINSIIRETGRTSKDEKKTKKRTEMKLKYTMPKQFYIKKRKKENRNSNNITMISIDTVSRRSSSAFLLLELDIHTHIRTKQQ